MEMNEKFENLKIITDQFHSNIKQYKSSSYDEANTRVDFIDKMFEILDWDVRNIQGYSEDYREVVREDKVVIEGKPKAPDYSFRIGKERKFFVEAKKPIIDIKQSIEPAFQLRRYAYTAKLPLSILTDFEEFAVYDTRIKPDHSDKANVARVFYCTYEDYEKEFEFLYNTFSKPAILKGSFDKYAVENKNKKGTSSIDKEFLKLIESWRNDLAGSIALKNDSLEDIYNLNTAVQIIIDRILFLRIAEDRNIEHYNTLGIIANSDNVYSSLNEYFKKADDKYNSGLFKIQDWLTNLKIDNKTLAKIINGLYYPECPYELSVMPIETLGNIYEQFLGKTITFKRKTKDGHSIEIEEKPEVRKAGGVYYTPQYIVDYIVENTVGKILMPEQCPLSPNPFLPEGERGEREEMLSSSTPSPFQKTGEGSFAEKTISNETLAHSSKWERVRSSAGEGISPEEASKIKICDPACGSGSFLVGAYKYLLDYYLKYYSDSKNVKNALKTGTIYQIAENTYRLSISEKQKILLNNIYGVDIDPQAVEVTKLSLLLRLMEDENLEAGGNLIKHSHTKLLPDLSNNIKCGNSLIGSDYYDDETAEQAPLFPNKEEIRKVNAFDWDKAFPEVFRKKEKKVEAFHITWVTHNSRTSERMKKYKVKKGDPLLLNDNDELLIVKTICKIIKEDKIRILAFNICKDHVHILIVCGTDKLTGIIQKMKSVSAREINIAKGITIPANSGACSAVDIDHSDRGESQNHLWARKFHIRQIEDDPQLINTMKYIHNNRIKHDLPPLNIEAYSAVQEVILTYEEAFSPEYEPGGFDCVIGNPPYVRQEMLTEFKPYFQNHYKVYHGVADLYTYFIEKGIALLHKDGFYSIIVANKWMRANYGKPLRDFLKLAGLQEIIDFGDLPVFQDATTYPCILTVQKEYYNKPDIDFSAVEVENLSFDKLSNYVDSNKFQMNTKTLSSEGWTLCDIKSSDLLEKIKTAGIPLGEYVQGKIFRGVLTGLNEAFVIDEETKNRLISEDHKSAEIIKPFLAGKDIKRYQVPTTNKYLIFARRGINIKAYPAIENYLFQFKEKLEPGKGRKPGSYKWYEIQDAVDYFNEFEKVKIIVPAIVKKASYCLDYNSIYSNDKTSIIASNDKYLLGVINSKVADYFVFSIASTKQGGYYEYKPMYFSKIPIPVPTDNKGLQPLAIHDKIVALVDQMLQAQQGEHAPLLGKIVSDSDKALHKQQIDILDRKIDKLVYELYGLNEDEIKIVEGDGK